MARPDLSVLMMVYNGQLFLSAQLHSIAAQALLPTELMVCGDGSSDDSRAVVLAFAAIAPVSTNLENSIPFERCVPLMQGDILLFSYQDDVWLPEKIWAVFAFFCAMTKKRVAGL